MGFIFPLYGLQMNHYNFIVVVLGHSVEWPLANASKLAIVSIVAILSLFNDTDVEIFMCSGR